MDTSSEWLKPKDVQKEYKIGHSTFWKWVKEEAFPVSRPGKTPTSGKGKAVFVRRADVERFINSGFSDQQTTPQAA